MSRRPLVLFLLIVLLSTSLEAQPVLQINKERLEWGLQFAPRPSDMPGLEEYRYIVESFVDTSSCRARINYVSVYHGVSWRWNSTDGYAATLVNAFDLLLYRSVIILVEDAAVYAIDDGAFTSTYIEVLSGIGGALFYFELDEDLYKQGYLFGSLYIRINETHVVNLTALTIAIALYRRGIDPRDYSVFCPPSRSKSLQRTITTTVTETVTSPVTVTLHFTEVATHTVTYTYTYTETKPVTYTTTVTEKITETKTIETGDGSTVLALSVIGVVSACALIPVLLGINKRKGGDKEV